MKGHLRRRGERSWAIVLDLGPDPVTGRRRQKWHTVQGTKRDAQRRLTELLKELQDGAYVEPSSETLGAYLARWLRDYAKPSLRQTTYESYESVARIHIVPAIGHLRLDRLKPTHLQQLYASRLAGGRADGREGGLSPRTVRYMHAIIREALKHAVKWGLLARNVADAVDPPRMARQELQAWSPADAQRFLAATQDDRLYPLYLMAITTGMRRGELLGLRWQDVDLDAGTLTIRHTLVHTNAGLVSQEPKTDRSRRSMPIPQAAVEALRRHRITQGQERWFAGDAYRQTDLVFTNPAGGPIEPRNLSRQFAARIRRAGVPRIRLHDLRHTHATGLLARGVHPKIVAERLGHSQIRVTMDTYSHVLPTMQREAADQAEAAFVPRRK